MTQTLVHQYALDPSVMQQQSLASHAGAVRFSYNWAVHHVLTNWLNVREGRDKEYVNTSAYSLRKTFNSVKNDIAPWWSEVSKEAFATGTANAARAFTNYYAKRGKLPRYKRKLVDDNAIKFTTGTRRLSEDGRYLTLPRLGRIRLHERAKRVQWLLKQGATLTEVSVKRIGNRWYASIQLRVEDALAYRYYAQRRARVKRAPVVGVDVGIKSAYVTSDGLVVDNPRHYQKALRKLRRLNKELARRQGLNKQTGEAPSNRWLRTRDKLRGQHARVAAQRSDFLHKASKQLVDKYESIVIEDLNVNGLARNRHLSQHIMTSGWGQFARQLAYKADNYEAILTKANRFYASSKTCSNCGVVKTTLSLSERIFSCATCGFSIDRDVNAALNLRNLVAQSCGETINGQGGGSAGSQAIASETAPNELSSVSTH